MISQYFKKIFRFAKPYKKYMYLNIFFNVLYALFSALSFLTLMPMLDVLFKNENKITETPKYEGIMELGSYLKDYMGYWISNSMEQNGPLQTLMILITVVIGTFLLKNLFNYWAMFFITFLRNGILKDIRNALYKKSVELPLSYFSEKRKGDMISRMTSDVLEIQHSFLSVLELLVREPLTIVFTIGAMCLISVELTLFVFIFIPIAGFLISLVGKSLKKNSDKAAQEQGIFLSIIDETLGGLKVIKGFNAEKTFEKKFEDSTYRFFKLNNKILNRQNLSSPMSEFLGIVTIATLLVYGGQMVLIDGTLSGAAFITYMGLAYGVLTPAKSISKASYSVKKGDAAAQRVLEILETKNQITNKPSAVKKSAFEQEISIENITFSYENDSVLKNFSLKVPKGQTVALVGQSGSGKSTIANLLTRFYDVQQGSIKIDGIDVKDFN